MDERTREVLEFDKVLELISGRAASALGRGFVESLEPLEHAGEVEARYAPLRDLMRLIDQGQSVPLGGLFDVRPLIKHAQVEGSVLDEEEWPRIALFLEICARFADFRDQNQKKLPSVAALLSTLETNPELIKRLGKTLDKDGRIRDDATPELARARRSLRSGEQRLLRLVSRLADDLYDRGILQENFSTIRNGRHVFPVKSSSRSRLSGIQHGLSSSGETAYIEPVEVVESSNELEYLREEERREVLRLLRDLTDLLRPFIPAAEKNVDLLSELDGLHALARTAAERGWHIPVVAREGAMRLFHAEHPLLNLRGGSSVPISILLERSDRCVVLSGPNAGGKTTAMKTIGLLSLLVKCGCPIPAFPDSSVPVYNDILADIGDQQDLEEGISTFTGHIRRIRELWRKAGKHCLVLMDELGTGTDPQEGGALAVALLEGFVSRASLTVTTSHLNPVKVWAEDTEGVRNASFSLDPHTREPTYTLRLDLPGASEALEIARKEGMPKEIMARAHELAGERQVEMGELLRRIEERERRLSETLKEAQARAKSLEDQEKLVRTRADLLRGERQEAREDALKERERLAGDLRGRLERMIAELPSEQELARRKEALVRAREEVLREQEMSREERRRLAEYQVDQGALSPGQRVFVKTLGQWGELLELGQSGRARLLIGNMEVSAREGDLLDHDPGERRAEQKARTEALEHDLKTGGKRKKKKKIKDVLQEAEGYSSASGGWAYRGKTPSLPSKPSSMTIDLHGYRVEEALAELDRYLDRSLLANFPYVKICHGTGTGRLYKAVHEFLRQHPAVKSYRFGTPDEGGGGITIVVF